MLTDSNKVPLATSPQNTYDKKQEISAVQVSINKRDELNTPNDGADGSKLRLRKQWKHCHLAFTLPAPLRSPTLQRALCRVFLTGNL